MHETCSSANLTALFQDIDLPEGIRKQILPELQKAFNSDNRGTRLSDDLAFGSGATIRFCTSPTRKFPVEVSSLVLNYFGDCCKIRGMFEHCASHTFADSFIVDIKIGTKLMAKGVVYHTVKTAPRDANIIIRRPSGAAAPCIIQHIFAFAGRVALAVCRYLPLEQAQIQRDPYRQYDFQVAGALYSRNLSDVEIVSSDNILAHFAKTEYLDEIAGELYHILPLAKVRNFGQGVQTILIYPIGRCHCARD